MTLQWPKVALAWMFVATGALFVRTVGLLAAGRLPTIEMAATDLTLIGMWALASPFVFRSAKRFPVALATPFPNAAIHVTIGSTFIVASNVAIRLPMVWHVGVHQLIADTGVGIATYYPGAIVCYLVLVAIGHWLAPARVADASPVDASVDAPHASNAAAIADDAKAPDRLVIREWNRVHLVALEDIEWIEADNNHVVVHANTRNYKGRERITDVEARLDERRFVRVHRSAIVHVQKIREVQPLAHGDHAVILKSGHVVRVARTRRQSLEAALGTSL